MKKEIVRVSLLVVMGLLLPAAASKATEPADPLWQKAVALAKRADDEGLKPGKLEMRAQVLKKDGTVEEDGVVLYRLVPDGDGLEVISAMENGKDVTAKAREEEAKARREQSGEKGKEKKKKVSISLEPGYHPFEPKAQGRVTCERIGETTLAGRKAVLFRFRESASAGKSGLTGQAWIDPDTGAPLQVETSLSPLPKYVDSLKSVVRFETTEDGLWHATAGEISGEGGLLWIRRVVKSSFRFLEWRKNG